MEVWSLISLSWHLFILLSETDPPGVSPTPLGTVMVLVPQIPGFDDESSHVWTPLHGTVSVTGPEDDE